MLLAYQENMKSLFKIITTENPTPTLEYTRRKRQTYLTDIGGERYLNNMPNPKNPTKKTRWINK